jgi:hypothetical protein
MNAPAREDAGSERYQDALAVDQVMIFFERKNHPNF